MTLRYLLDTNAVSEPALAKPSSKLVERLTRDGHHCAIGAPVWHELVFGVRRLPAGKRRTGLMEYLENVVHRSFPVLAYDEAAAAWHGTERARLDSLGHPTSFVDGQIAAIAIVHGLELITNNTKDYRHFEGLSMSNWR